MPVISAPRKLREDDGPEFEATLSYPVRLFLKKNVLFIKGLLKIDNNRGSCCCFFKSFIFPIDLGLYPLLLFYLWFSLKFYDTF